MKKGKENKLLVEKCVIYDRPKTMIVFDNVIQAEGHSDFFKNLGSKGLDVSKNMAKNVLKYPCSAPDNTAKIATAAASRKPKNIMKSPPELITFYNTGKALYLGKFL